MCCTIDLRSDDRNTNEYFATAAVSCSSCTCARPVNHACFGSSIALSMQARGIAFLPAADVNAAWITFSLNRAAHQVMESSAVPGCPYLIHTFRDSMRFVNAELEWKKEFTAADPLRCRFISAAICRRVELNSSTQLRDWATGQIILSCPSPCF